MCTVHKYIIILSLTLHGSLVLTITHADQRGAYTRTPGLEFIRLGDTRTISELNSHPSPVYLGLNGLVGSHHLRHSNGQPVFQRSSGGGRYFCNSLTPNADPYFLLLLSHYSKYLPYGLGSQAFYGSTGLPKTKLWPTYKYGEKP